MAERKQITEKFEMSYRQEARSDKAMKISNVLTIVGLFIASLSVPVIFCTMLTETAAVVAKVLLIVGFGIAILGLVIIMADIVIMAAMIAGHAMKIAIIKLMAQVLLKYFQLKAAEERC